VGREAEMQQIRRALELAAAGRGQIVAVVGEPGTGKSRLFHEVKRGLVEDGGTVLEMCAVAYGRAYPYVPLVALLRDYFVILPEDDEGTRRAKIADAIVHLDA